jgi:hypothetical protein
MRINNHDAFVEITSETKSYKDFIPLLKTEISSKYQKNNIVVNLLKIKSFYLEDLLLFLTISNSHRSNNKSFVIINNAINPDSIPDEIVVVPTLQEAEDIIEMEEIERELGF